MEIKVNPKDIYILLVEDDHATSLLTAKILKSLGYQVVEANDGEVALLQISTNPNIGLIITDHQMPNLNGLDLIKILKCHSEFMKIPCILTSADENSRNEALGLGCSAWVAKPIKKVALETILSDAHIQKQLKICIM